MELNAKKMMNSLSKGNSILKAIQENDRKHLQKVLTMMLRDLMKVTDKYGIVMPVAYGNVLGAVRHHGFIPWDDDLDVYMMRKDWEKFKKVFDKELGYKYILEGPNTNELCPKNTFPKVYLKGTEFTDIYDVNTPYQHGIYIDIFITDYVPSSKLLQKIDGFVSKVIKFGINSQTYYQYPNPVMEKFMHQSGGGRFSTYGFVRLLAYSSLLHHTEYGVIGLINSMDAILLNLIRLQFLCRTIILR